ncbi:cytochrome P450 [Shimazuella alba]|uniref:Cytochrome P450 n=1 Tax=Shimazuella alba TaxID=2690964 RepID=A0A6I4VNC4_9BACL|nr:cytochrome P450 [Shimazuella alba]MXQ53017.1 cytochrome P450 [Shimazuella alba]
MKHSFSNPFPWYNHMLKQNPVTYDEDFLHYFGAKGTWHIFRYDDVQKVFQDHETFSNEYFPKIAESPVSIAMSVTDPPRHKQLRLLISKAFTPKAIEDMKPWIEQITHELLDQVEDKGEMDVTRDLAVPIPIQVIAKLLGISHKDQDKFKKWSIMFAKQPSEVDGGAEGYFQAQKEMSEYFLRMIKFRKQEPEDDLISQLLQAEVDGEKLSANDVLAFCILLLIAGNETTTNLINNAIFTFIEHPEVQEHLIDHPEDITKAIEEVLRYRSPLQYINRIAAKDTELRGKRIKKGDFINLWMGSANRDESVFANPNEFDIHRTNLKHTAFGHGIHYCMGAPLARLEANIALRVLLGRLHQFQLKDHKQPVMNQSAVTYSIKEFPVTFQKR